MKLEDKQKRFGNWFIPVIIGCFSLVVIYWAYSEAPTHRHYNPSSAHSADNTYEQSSSISKLPPNVDAKTKTTKKHSKKDEESFVAERSDLADERKLTKKGELSADTRIITTIYLDEAEFALLSTLAGQRIIKRRHYFAGNPEIAVDIFLGANKGLICLLYTSPSPRDRG